MPIEPHRIEAAITAILGMTPEGSDMPRMPLPDGPKDTPTP